MLTRYVIIDPLIGSLDAVGLVEGPTAGLRPPWFDGLTTNGRRLGYYLRPVSKAVPKNRDDFYRPYNL